MLSSPESSETALPVRRKPARPSRDVLTFNGFTFERTKLTEADRAAIQRAVRLPA